MAQSRTTGHSGRATKDTRLQSPNFSVSHLQAASKGHGTHHITKCSPVTADCLSPAHQVKPTASVSQGGTGSTAISRLEASDQDQLTSVLPTRTRGEERHHPAGCEQWTAELLCVPRLCSLVTALSVLFSDHTQRSLLSALRKASLTQVPLEKHVMVILRNKAMNTQDV